MGPMHFKKNGKVGTRSTASETAAAKNSDALERVPTRIASLSQCMRKAGE